ncbi:MAG TPA: lysylphosphatidylglycerol synthase transmembrane domain-containing protein [Nitrososphaera sp.]|nr:lysylphosphatidylglycerol synthase transmembrane domain-containing protein [Nitrososphaera sp.]
MNWRLIAIPASIVPFIILIFTANVSPQDILAVGFVPFLASAAAAIIKMLLQALRFKYFIRHFLGYDVASTGKTIAARLAGEFVTQTTPSYVGGEIVRIAWLTRNGVPPGKAAWVTSMEIVADVFVGTLLAFIAGALAIYRGGSVIGLAVILVTIPTLAIWLGLILYSAKRTLQLPSFSQKIVEKFLSKKRSENLINSTNTAIADLCNMSREIFSSKKSIRTFAVGIAITVVAFVFQGISFMVLANAVEPQIGLFDSLMATSASTAVANLPITIGGSGLAELGIWAYLANLNGIPTINEVVQDSQLNVIIAWRIATYHVPLVLAWIALMKVTVYRIPAPDIRNPITGHEDKKPDNNNNNNNTM